MYTLAVPSVPLPWLPAQTLAVGHFLALAAPWVRLGANVLPIAPGAKSPAVAGWGDRGPRAHELAEGWGLGPHSLHSENSPKIPAEALAQWGARYRDLNCAVLPGSMGAMVVDVDDPVVLDSVIEVCGDTPYRTYSGREGGGIHLWYRGVASSRNAIAPRVDIKSNRGYVIAPGSIHHRTGAPYGASPELVALLAAGTVADLPVPTDGWREALAGLGTRITHPTRLDLASLADRLLGRGERTNGKLLRAIAEGRPFAEPGERDAAVFHAVRAMSEAWPHASDVAIAALFAQSAGVMEGIAPCEIPIVEAVAQKWERLAGVAEDVAIGDDAHTRELRRGAHLWVHEDSDAVEDPRAGPIVVHTGRSYWLRVGETFVGPVPWTREDFTPDVLAKIRAVYALDDVADLSALLARFGERAAEVKNSLAVRRTVWDAATSVLHCAAGSIRHDLVAERSVAVESIIAEIGGQYAPQLTWWLAGLLRADLPCRALILSGSRGRGKSLLLDGMGSLWPDGAAKLRDVLGKRFNSSIASAGLAVGDDDTSPSESGEALATFLREGVHDRVQRLERKHHDVAKLTGCMRYALGTNDAFSLVESAVSWKMNQASIEAFGDRLLHIPVPDSAVGCWERAGVTGEQLVAGGMIARHILWLSEVTAGMPPLDRFWVGEGDPDLHRLAVMSSGLRGDLLLRISEGLGSSGASAWVRDEGDGRVLVSAGGLLSAWMDAPRSATVRSVGLALGALAAASECETHRHTGGVRWHAVDRSLVDWYARLAGY